VGGAPRLCGYGNQYASEPATPFSSGYGNQYASERESVGDPSSSMFTSILHSANGIREDRSRASQSCSRLGPSGELRSVGIHRNSGHRSDTPTPHIRAYNQLRLSQSALAVGELGA
jgi:hypothetical protein